MAEVERRAWAEDAADDRQITRMPCPGSSPRELSHCIEAVNGKLVPGDYVGQGKIMDLTATEHRLLTCLVRNAGRTVSHRELLEVMRSSNPGSSMDNLRQCISRLRKKIEIDPALPKVIITHHRQGYSFAGKQEARWFPELDLSDQTTARAPI